MNLEKVSQGRDNNLDLIRFIAAVMVIFCHAFPIGLGEGILDPLAAATADQISFGSLAVGIFFVYGGFLICKSMCRVKTADAYFKARIMRIIPPLLVVTLFLTVVVGPILTKLTISEYFTDMGTYKYLLNSVFVLQHNLPGVFVNNIYGQAVNGPLWTLPIEFICYVMCFIAYKCKLINKKGMITATIIFTVGCIGAWILSSRITILASMIRPMGLFFAGMLYYVYRDKIPMNPWIAIGCLVGMVLSAVLNILSVTIFFLFPYFFMYIGFGTKVKFSNFAKHGEVSYGMYLTAWPVQQILSQLLSGTDGRMNPYVNFVITVPVAIILGWVICKCVEAPVLNWSKKNK